LRSASPRKPRTRHSPSALPIAVPASTILSNPSSSKILPRTKPARASPRNRHGTGNLQSHSRSPRRPPRRHQPVGTWVCFLLQFAGGVTLNGGRNRLLVPGAMPSAKAPARQRFLLHLPAPFLNFVQSFFEYRERPHYVFERWDVQATAWILVQKRLDFCTRYPGASLLISGGPA